ncbi:MAG: hypothetical protein IJN15_00340 [Clostridia bacterium]|nr:hypothetical protein [Clostridia bacterium]
MEISFFKRIISVCLVVFLCLGISLISFANTATAIQKRVVEVEADTIVTESFLGLGNNLWTGEYTKNYGMNEAYQTVSDKRNNIVKPAYMRMMFLPGWLVFLDETPERQQELWESGIYNWENENVKSFFRKLKMFKESGTLVMINMGGRVHYEMNEWFSIKDVALSEGGTRSAPRNLDAFAEATYAVFERAWNYGYDNVQYLTFYNEVNGGNYEAFGDKRVYWCEMIARVHEEFKGNTFKGVNAREKIKIVGTDLTGYVNSERITDYLNFVRDNLVDENGAPIYDVLGNHQYIQTKTYDEWRELTDKIGQDYPGIFINEFGPADDKDGKKCIGFGYSETSQFLAYANAGIGAAATWFYSGDYVPEPMKVPINSMDVCMWVTPSTDIDGISGGYAEKGLLTRYIPKFSQVIKTNTDADDVFAAAFHKDGEYTIAIEVDRNEAARELEIKLGDKLEGKKFERHIYEFPELRENGYEYYDEKRADGDLLPVTDKILVCNGGKITDTVAADGHYLIVYTTIKEQIQLVANIKEVAISAGDTVELKVDQIYGADGDTSAVTYSIYGKSTSDEIYENVTTNVGSLTNVNGATATYKSSGTSSGDTVAIKISSNYADESGESAYTIVIVNIVE